VYYEDGEWVQVSTGGARDGNCHRDSAWWALHRRGFSVQVRGATTLDGETEWQTWAAWEGGDL